MVGLVLQSTTSMVTRASLKLVNIRHFSSTTCLTAQNRIYSSVRNPSEFHTLLLSSSSSRTVLITLWTASWCSHCKTVSPLLQDLLSAPNSILASNLPGHPTGDLPPVAYAEIELDSPDIEDLPSRYMINNVPTLLAYSRQEPQMDTRVTDLKLLKDEAFLRGWIETEARRAGDGGDGGGIFGRLFGSK